MTTLGVGAAAAVLSLLLPPRYQAVTTIVPAMTPDRTPQFGLLNPSLEDLAFQASVRSGSSVMYPSIVRSRRLLDTRIVLCHDSQKLFLAVQRVEQRKRALAPDSKGLNTPRKKHDLADRKDRQFTWNRNRLISHWGPFPHFYKPTSSLAELPI